MRSAGGGVGRMPSVDATHFAMEPRASVPRSAFDVCHGIKMTLNASPVLLYPICCYEILPGDTFSTRFSAFVRLATPLVPMMDNLEFMTEFFFVPNRLVWSNWKRFMGEQSSPSDTTSFLVPQAQLTQAAGDFTPAVGVADAFGLTVNNSANTLNVNALPFRAYYLIWNDWYRDENLQNPVTVALGDGPDAAGTYALLNRNKRPDYFTTALPWPQKPVNASVMPDATGLNAGALGNGFPGIYQQLNGTSQNTVGAGAPLFGIGVGTARVVDTTTTIAMPGNRNFNADYYSTSVAPLYVKATEPGSVGKPDIRVLVSDLRTSIMVQNYLERNARGGTRYTELVFAHFGVRSPDARLQRPELLGGGRTMIQVNPVAQTSASGVAGTTTKLGELAGIGAAMVHGHGFHQSFTEHGFVIGVCSVRSFLTYQQGVERMWSRRTQFDHYFPETAHLGEQAILKQELYADGSATDVTVFGYQERWAEYKWKPSITTGFFKSTNATPLDMWHLGQKFASAPSLNSAFIIDSPPITRVMQVATLAGEDLIMDGLFETRMVRCMPVYSIPGLGARL